MTAQATTLSPRELRKRIVAASSKRRAPTKAKPIPRPLPPTGIATAYTTMLLALSRSMDAAIMKVLAPSLRADSIRLDAPADGGHGFEPEEIKRLIREMTRQLEHMTGAPALLKGLNQIAARTGQYSQEQWRQQLQKSLGIDLSRDVHMAPLVAKFRKTNVALISSLADDKVSRVHRVLSDAGPGTRVEEIQRRIVEQTGATESRAALIARDQVLKLNANVTQQQHEAAGITSYTWSTSRDERVRHPEPGKLGGDHKDLEGHVFEYSKPPVVDTRTGRRANPGEDYQCRCCAIPILDGIDTDAVTEPSRTTPRSVEDDVPASETVAVVPPPPRERAAMTGAAQTEAVASAARAAQAEARAVAAEASEVLAKAQAAAKKQAEYWAHWEAMAAGGDKDAQQLLEVRSEILGAHQTTAEKKGGQHLKVWQKQQEMQAEADKSAKAALDTKAKQAAEALAKVEAAKAKAALEAAEAKAAKNKAKAAKAAATKAANKAAKAAGEPVPSKPKKARTPTAPAAVDAPPRYASFDDVPRGEIPKKGVGKRPSINSRADLIKHVHPAAKAAVTEFTGIAYGPIRDTERLTEARARAELGSRYAEAKAQSNAINKMFADAPASFKSPGRVYRGIGLRNGITGINDFLGKSVLDLEATSSASTNVDISVHNFAERQGLPYQVLYVLDQASGISIEEISGIRGESEVLLRKGTQYRITKFERTRSRNGELLIIHATEITTGRVDGMDVIVIE